MAFDDAHKIETYKSMISISTEAFKALQYLNGGSIVAMLTYIGHMQPFDAKMICHLKYSLTFFIIGLVSATVVFITAYLTQLSLHNENIGNTAAGNHKVWLGISLLLCSISLLFFSIGAFSTLSLFNATSST